MGFFSFKTVDTDKSVSNRSSSRGALPVYFLIPNGQNVRENNYEGYGKFGGLDCYSWLAKSNLPPSSLDGLTEDEIRYAGIDLAFSGKDIKYPIKLAEHDIDYFEYDSESPSCPEQGFFYDS